MMQTFRVESDSWVAPAILGLVVYLFSLVFDNQFFYIHLYLIVASIITFVISLSKYATADERHFILYYGILLFRKKMTFKWDEIAFVEPLSVEKRSFVTAGGGRGGVVSTHSENSVVFHLNQKVPHKMQSSVKIQNRFLLFRKGIEISDDGLEIKVQDEPKCGFHKFLSILSEYTDIKNFKGNSETGKINGIVISYSHAFVIFLILMYFIFFSYQLTG